MKAAASIVVMLALCASAQGARTLLQNVCTVDGNIPAPNTTCSTTYWACAKGQSPVPMQCAAGTVFNSATGGCDFRANVAECPYQADLCPGAGTFASSANCSTTFWSCPAFQAEPTVMNCSEGTYFNALTGVCDFKSNIPVCNDECLTPAYLAASIPEFSILSAVIDYLNLTDALNTLTPAQPATYFLPPNGAFIELLAKLNVTAEQLFSPASVSTLTKVLLTHVVPGVAAKAASLTNGQVLTTANANQTLTVGINNGTVTLLPQSNDAAIVIFPDLALCNAIGHVVTKVLVPSNL